MRVQAGIGLGSNVGDRADNIRRAVEAITALEKVTLGRVSALYSTPPWGETDQPDFLNAAAIIDMELSPHGLLSALKSIEQDIGRVETYRWGPRVIDIDILYYGGVVLSDDRLTLPHKALFDRAFVLVPLAEICGRLRVSGREIREVAEAHPDRGTVIRVEG